MEIFVVDGTYELFRHFFAVPSYTDAKGQEIAATRAVVASIISMLEKGATHIGVATDHVIESFRNQLYPYYKTGDGIPEVLFSQFEILEDALDAMGVLVWPMVEFEADDALASAAIQASNEPSVSRVIVCTPDKDLYQCVRDPKIVQLDRRRNIYYDEAAVLAKFGVKPESVPDFLALVGDSADGFPGLQGWGPKTAASVLAHYTHFENIPKDPREWHQSIKSAAKLADSLKSSWSDALLFRTLATLRTDVPVFTNVEEMRYRGPKPAFDAVAERLKAPDFLKRIAAVPAS